MTSAQSGQAYRIIRTIERNLRRLEELVRDMEARTPEMRPQDARSELLEHVHVAGAMEQRRLFELLDQRGITHAWIGAQVGAEYLDLWQAADGQAWYRVTQRAIRELHLGQLALSAATFAPPSESAFSDDWDSEQDSVYDQL
ncbi:MAG: hypothetical protein QF714_04345 [Dehalococcoidia bacterium]|jgi:hypothetical protein|nr:hypothetical protein [Dehalococcoidia bacterium]MDP6226922.1 hypothetical protein [Dehalococcoidia bacterium]MDP7082831.1 hypothetical protein [Dehalococcoidia bacterium]MDP7200175.1 hypothetical protein [Dehalococcoidia bacterium]MDP7509709.1 hypothetical protein [Dehalococcoidia bacterium]|tara:strand:- start:2884 stop:3309 length:426 start_codon:yes stop_codon:yes gene_type:complete